MLYYRQEVKAMQAASDELLPEIRAQVERGISVLKQGGLVAFPTDTVYGLGACADNEQAVAKVYRVKERPMSLALPLLLADSAQIKEVADSVPAIAWRLIEKFLPGPLTIVLYKAESVLDAVTGGGDTVAVRIPAHPVPVALAERVGPIVGTSANLTGKPSPLTAGEVRSQLGDKLDLIIDGGWCPGGRESTVVDVTGDVPVILREGPISREALKEVCEEMTSGEKN